MRMPLPHGYYYDIARHPLAGTTLEEVRRYRWARSGRPGAAHRLRKALQAAHAGGTPRSHSVGDQRGGRWSSAPGLPVSATFSPR